MLHADRIDEPPEILITNYQYPGNPPLSQVAIFATCPSINYISEDDSEETKAYKRLWQEFTDFPVDDEPRLKCFENAPSQMSSWKTWFSDITWANKEQKGVYPHSDFRNKRWLLDEACCPVLFC